MRIELVTERLTLVPLGPEHLDAVHAYSSDLENTRFMVHFPSGSLEETARFLQNVSEEWNKALPEKYEFAVFHLGRMVGNVSLLLEPDRASAELAWIINQAYWGMGFATEAAQALIDYGREALGISHFFAHCDSENIGSYRVMERLGMIRTGEWNGRKNRSSDDDRREYRYDLP